jgi:hypothetical protein
MSSNIHPVFGARMRHRGPGGGSIYGPNAEVSADSTLEMECLVRGDSDVVESRVTLMSHVIDSRLYRASVAHSTLDRCRVFQATVQYCTLTGVTVKDGAQVYGVFVTAPGLRIDRGEWWRDAPAWAMVGNSELPDDHVGVRTVISECKDDRFHIGCWCLTYDEWTREGYRERLGKSAGWAPEQIEFAYDIFTDWRLLRREGPARY